MADVQKPVQKRQPEGRGLAGAGLGKAHQVAALHDVGNGLRLDRRGRLERGLFQCLQDLGRKAEGVESGHVRSVHRQRRPALAHRDCGWPCAPSAPLRDGGNLSSGPDQCSRGTGCRTGGMWGKRGGMSSGKGSGNGMAGVWHVGPGSFVRRHKPEGKRVVPGASGWKSGRDCLGWRGPTGRGTNRAEEGAGTEQLAIEEAEEALVQASR